MQVPEEALNNLIETAIRLGASDAGIIPSAAIVIDDGLAKLCNGDPQCENYGLAPSCPPHVCGPAGFRKWQTMSEYAIVVRIDIPTTVMFSSERREIMQLLHEIVAGVEVEASGMGYIGSKAFAGGSCKKIFCREHADCRILAGHGECRNPQSARPSMSGFGINVSELLQSAGWPAKPASRQQASDAESMTWVAGLIVLMKGD